MAGLEDTLSGAQVALSDVFNHLNGLELDYGKNTEAAKSMLRESQKGVKEDTCVLIRNLRTFVEISLRAIRVRVDEVRVEWASYRNSPTVSLGAIKVANQPAKLIDGTAKGVTVHLADYHMVLGMAFFNQPSSPTSSKDIKSTEGVPKKRKGATSRKRQPRPTKEGTMNANPPLPQRRPACTKLKEPTRCSARLTPDKNAILHERLPKPKSTRPKEPTRGRLQHAWRTRDEDVANSSGGGCHGPQDPNFGFQPRCIKSQQEGKVAGRI